MKEKNKMITLRVEQSLYEFLKEFAFHHNQTVSEMVRTILKYFYMRFLIGDFTDKDYNTARREFLRKFDKLPEIYSPDIWREFIKNRKTTSRRCARKSP